MTCCGLWSLAVHLLLSIFGVSGVVVVVQSWSTLRPPALCHHMLSLYFIPGRCNPHLHIQCWTEHRFLFFFSPGCGCVPSPCLLQCVPSSCCPSPFYPMRCCSLSPTATTCSGSMDHSFMVITNVLTRVTQSRGAVDYRECHYVCKHSLRCNEYRCEQASRSILHRGLCPNRDGELLWMDKL